MSKVAQLRGTVDRMIVPGNADGDAQFLADLNSIRLRAIDAIS
jgi:hypothetical protein